MYCISASGPEEKIRILPLCCISQFPVLVWEKRILPLFFAAKGNKVPRLALRLEFALPHHLNDIVLDLELRAKVQSSPSFFAGRYMLRLQ